MCVRTAASLAGVEHGGSADSNKVYTDMDPRGLIRIINKTMM
jgi:hypothetical protein